MFFSVRRTLIRLSASLLIIAIAVQPGVALGVQKMTDYVRTDAPTVSRGEFLTWAVNALNLRRDAGCKLTYPRVPRAMVGTLCAVQSEGGLAIFGNDLFLARDIKRGEALVVLTALSGKQSSGDVSKYRDVRGTDMQRAVRNAITHRWMNPVSNTTFGVERKLSGTEALSLLQALTGTAPSKQENGTTIRIRIDTTRTRSPGSNVTTSTSGLSTSNLPQSSLINSIWQLIQRDYLRYDNVDSKEVGYGIIEGLVKGLGDPYSNFFRPAQADNFQTQIRGELSGIGAHVEEHSGIVTIIAPLPGSPAEKAGLKPADQILEADGHDLRNIGIDEAVAFIRGERGTTVVLKIRRGDAEFEVKVVRDTVTIPEIEVTWRGTIAVIKVVQFGDTTNAKFRELMHQLTRQNPAGIVLDLRNNPGGLLSAAGIVLSNFVPQGTVVAQVKGRTSNSSEITNDPPTIDNNVGLAVLVNGGSASASEIVAGALQDHRRATVVGTKTFGKGTVQELLTFHSGEALKLTVAEWLTPNGREIDGVGIVPDVIVENEDQQLQRAISEVQ